MEMRNSPCYAGTVFRYRKNGHYRLESSNRSKEARSECAPPLDANYQEMLSTYTEPFHEELVFTSTPSRDIGVAAPEGT